ncbi:MAG: AMP-binding protein [Pseudomonadota bacterium]
MKNLTRYVEFHARLRPDADALVFAGEHISWSAFHDRILATAAGLAEHSVGPDTIVALAMKNSPAFLELTYALSHLGAIALPLNYRLSAEEVGYIVDHAGTALALADEELLGLTSDLTIPVLTVDAEAQRDSRALFGGIRHQAPIVPRSGDDLYRLMYTSGTTSRPKGVMITYDNLYWKNVDHIIALQVSAEDRLCVVGPLYHVGGCELPGLAVHMAGGTILLLRDFDAVATLDMIATERATGIWLAPVMTNAILAEPSARRFDTSCLKWCIAGGERTPESRIRSFVEAFPATRYVDAYGMTETVSGDTLMEPGFEIAKIGSVGRALQFVEIEIRDDAGHTLPPGMDGEICMRGAKVTQGYWKEPHRTAEAFWPDGFLRSGDVGHLDDDGFLYLTDRKKDMIISGGENIAASEVERVIYELPQVLEAAVVARPDARWGEVPVAVVVLREGVELDRDSLIAHCRAHLAGFKCPKDLVVRDMLPRNPSGKVLKRVLRDELAGDA